MTYIENSSLSISILLLSFLSPMIANVVMDKISCGCGVRGDDDVKHETKIQTEQNYQFVQKIRNIMKCKISKVFEYCC